MVYTGEHENDFAAHVYLRQQQGIEGRGVCRCQRDDPVGLGFGRIAVSELERPNMLVALV
jgi:hypothetical protein